MFFKEATNLRDGPLSYVAAKTAFTSGARLALGLAQMFVAVFSAILLLETGLNRWSLTSAGFPTSLTATSRLLFHKKRTSK